VVRGVHGSDSRIHISSGSAGQTSFDGSGSGLLLTAQNMNVTSKFTPAIMFGTKDTDFTTTNPKVGAAINAIASQTYSTDSTGGMDLAFYTTPNDPGTGQTTTERMRIDSSGNVGIGETTPSAKLQVNGGAADYTSSATGTGLFHVSGGATSEYTFYVGVADQGVQLGHNGGGSRFLSFETNETERMRIDSSGSLLVGRTSGVGSERLAVQGAALVGTFYSANSTANGTLMSYYSDVGGTQQQVAAMQRDGDIFNANNTYGALSDERLKSNIVDASSQLDDIMAVQVRSYTLNATGNTHIGVVAQELEASGMSGLVSEDENGMKSVKYSVLYMKAIKAIQEQQAMIETLQAQVAELQGAN
jgi:hypothetical protein